MPDWLAVIILGIIEGITEFLPISSTGHLLIPQNFGWLPKQTDLFDVVIQSGAVLAVLAVDAVLAVLAVEAVLAVSTGLDVEPVLGSRSHDTLSGLEGIATRSEGDDPYRRVVIAPANG